MPVPEMGIKYTFDDSEASRGINRINQMLQNLDTTSQNVANTASGAFAQIEKMIRQLEISAKPLGGAMSLIDENVQRVDQMIGALYGVTEPLELFNNTMSGSIQRYTQMTSRAGGLAGALERQSRATAQATTASQINSQTVERASKIFAGTSEAAKSLRDRMAEWTADPADRIKTKVEELERANKELGEEVETEGEKEEGRIRKVLAGLRQWRWGLITIIFFVTKATRAVKSMWTMMAEAEEMAMERMGVQALAAMYQRNVGYIIDSMRELSLTSTTAMELLEAAQRGFLQDQGRFASSYGALWQAAQRTAAAAGEEAIDHFEAFVEALARGDAEVLDNVNIMFQAQHAVQQYASSMGTTAKDVDDATQSQIIYNRIMEISRDLQAAGIDEDLERVESIGKVKDAWADLRQEVGLATAASLEHAGAWRFLGNAIDFATRALTTWVASSVLMRHLTRDLPTIPDVSGIGPGLDEYPRLVEEANQRSLHSIADHLLRRQRLIDDNADRIHKINLQHRDRTEDIEIRHQQRLAKIERDYQRNKASRLRKYNRRVDEEGDDFRLKELQAERDHLQELRHMRERYQLTTLQNERMYNYERMMLVAEGDVLAIEDLDARYGLEQRARKENQQQRTRETKEEFREDQTQRLEKHRLELDQLKDAYEDQLVELRLQLEEQQLEAEIQRDEAMRQEQRDYDQRLRDQAESHESEMTQWAEHWANVADQAELGAAEVTRIIRDYFGPGGETSQIIQSFLARYQQLMDIYANIEKIKSQVASTTPAPFVRPPIGASEEILGYWQYAGRPYQFGGSGLVTRPTLVPMGESGPERFSVQPVSMGGSLVLQWGGGPIPVHGTGNLSGMDLSGIGDVIAKGLVIEISNQLSGRRI